MDVRLGCVAVSDVSPCYSPWMLRIGIRLGAPLRLLRLGCSPWLRRCRGEQDAPPWGGSAPPNPPGFLLEEC
jgi:hypothetical protein